MRVVSQQPRLRAAALLTSCMRCSRSVTTHYQELVQSWTCNGLLFSLSCFAVNARCVSSAPPEGGSAAPKLHVFQPGLSQPYHTQVPSWTRNGLPLSPSCLAVNACCLSAAPPGAGSTALKLHVFQLGLSQPTTINKGRNEHVTDHGLLSPSCFAVNACCVSAAPPEGGSAAHKLHALQSVCHNPLPRTSLVMDM